MATYYRWQRREIRYTSQKTIFKSPNNEEYFVTNEPQNETLNIATREGDTSDIITLDSTTGKFSVGAAFTTQLHYGNIDIPDNAFIYEKWQNKAFYSTASQIRLYNDADGVSIRTFGIDLEIYESILVGGPFVEYVYSTSSSAYPNGGVQGGYYYDQRTTVTSPTAPTGLTYPNPITTPTVTVSWTASTSNTSYPVTKYRLYGKPDSASNFTLIGETEELSLSYNVGSTTFTTIQFKVYAVDSNGAQSSEVVGPVAQIIRAPTLTVPQMVMQGQSATISWSAIEGADSYTLQRKSSADTDWTQVYSGANLSYTETVGTWTSLQYRVCAVFGETSGGWATSDSIQIVSASALVISGSDGDLGTLTSDVQYSVSSDQTGNTISVSVEVNGGEYAEFTATSGQTYSVSVLDLPTGTGSIVITATTEVSSSPVTVTRTWTYSKTAQTFPSAGSVGQLTQEGNVVYPETLVEAVRASMTPWGGNLSTALELLKRAALYNRTQTPKYKEVKVDLSQITTQDAKNGKIIMLPYKGIMTPHIVVQVGNPDPEMYDSSCDGVWLLRQNIVQNGEWNSSGTNVLPNSTIMTTMQGYVANYDSTVSSQIKTVKIPYCVGNGSSAVQSLGNGLECKIFPLGGYEIGFTISTNGTFPVDGSVLEYFSGPNSSAKHQLLFNGNPSKWWTRSPRNDSNNSAHLVLENGTYQIYDVGQNIGYAYCFILPTSFSSTYLVDNSGTIHASQEYTEAGEWLDVWGNAIPAVKMETGSYVGTGTYGSSNPNTLTFGGEPQFVSISGKGAGANSGHAIFQKDVLVSNFSPIPPVGSTANNSGGISASWVNNQLSFYSSDPTKQLNFSGSEYGFFAITLPGGDTQ